MNKNTIAFILIGLSLFWMMSNDAKERELREKEAKALESQKKSTATESDEVVQGSAQLAHSYRAPTLSVDSSDTSKVDTLAAPELKEEEILVQTENFDVKFSNKGAKVTSIILKDLKSEAGEYPELIEKTDLGMLGLEIDEKDFSNVLWEVQEKSNSKVKFLWQDAQGRKIYRVFKFEKDALKFSHKLVFEKFKPEDLRIDWAGGMKETEDVSKIGSFGGQYYFSEVVWYDGEDVYRETASEKEKFNEEKAGIQWLGLRRRYATVFMNFPEPVKSTILTLPIEQPEDNPSPLTYDISWNQEVVKKKVEFDVHIQPLEYESLKALGGHQNEILFSGWSIIGANYWFVAICGLILSFLNSLFGFLGNYGLAIIILTLLVKLATMPMTIKQIKSMRSMVEHKPALDALRKKYSKDPQRYQMEMLSYYKKVGINPLAPVMGCLPMVLQMPIFIGLFVVLGRAVELRGQPFYGWIYDLAQPDIIFEAIKIPLIMPNGLSLLPPIMAITMYYQMKQSMTNTDPVTKNMVFIMPVMMFLFSAVMPSGLVIYWIVSNLFTIFQYRFIGSANSNPEGVKDAEIVK